MPTIAVYADDRIYGSLAALMTKADASSPGGAAGWLLKQIFKDDRRGERLRSLLEL